MRPHGTLMTTISSLYCYYNQQNEHQDPVALFLSVDHEKKFWAGLIFTSHSLVFFLFQQEFQEDGQNAAV